MVYKGGGVKMSKFLSSWFMNGPKGGAVEMIVVGDDALATSEVF